MNPHTTARHGTTVTSIQKMTPSTAFIVPLVAGSTR
jgi:hypothetical protein